MRDSCLRRGSAVGQGARGAGAAPPAGELRGVGKAGRRPAGRPSGASPARAALPGKRADAACVSAHPPARPGARPHLWLPSPQSTMKVAPGRRTSVPLTLRLLVGAPEEVPSSVTASPVGSDQSWRQGSDLGRCCRAWRGSCGARAAGRWALGAAGGACAGSCGRGGRRQWRRQQAHLRWRVGCSSLLRWRAARVASGAGAGAGAEGRRGRSCARAAGGRGRQRRARRGMPGRGPGRWPPGAAAWRERLSRPIPQVGPPAHRCKPASWRRAGRQPGAATAPGSASSTCSSAPCPATLA